MSEIFDIPKDKPKKEKREMTPEAKEKLLERLRAGREKAKAKRAEAKAKIKLDPIVEEPIIQPDSEPETTDDNNNLNDDDVRVLASQIQELENQVNEKKKRTYKKRDGVMINKAKASREKYINDTVARKVAEQMGHMNVSKPVVKSVSAPVIKSVPAPVAIKKVSKFAGKIKPMWARGFDI